MSGLFLSYPPLLIAQNKTGTVVLKGPRFQDLPPRVGATALPNGAVRDTKHSCHDARSIFVFLVALKGEWIMGPSRLRDSWNLGEP